MLRHQEALAQQISDVRSSQDAAKPVESVLLLDRVDEVVEAFLETRIAEVGQASGATAGPIHQRVLPKWQRMGACAAGDAVADIHGPDRQRSRRRFNGDGGSLLNLYIGAHRAGLAFAPPGRRVALRQY